MREGVVVGCTGFCSLRARSRRSFSKRRSYALVYRDTIRGNLGKLTVASRYRVSSGSYSFGGLYDDRFFSASGTTAMFDKDLRIFGNVRLNRTICSGPLTRGVLTGCSCSFILNSVRGLHSVRSFFFLSCGGNCSVCSLLNECFSARCRLYR